MVETITPVVHGGRRSRWAVAVALHTLGAVLGAAMLGAVVGAAGMLLGAPWPGGWMLVAAVAGVYVLRELGAPIPVPQLRRQVPESWRRSFSPGVSSFLYGLVLGTGFTTHLRHGALIASSAVAFVGGSPLQGIVALAPFGLARGVSLVAVWPATTGEAGERVVEAVERWAERGFIRWVHVAVLVALGAAVAGAGEGLDGPTLVRATGLALAGVFAWAGLAKLAAARAWRESLAAFALPGPIRVAASYGVPLAELAVAAALLFAPARDGATAAAALLVAFSLFLDRARRRTGRQLPCGCFGGRRRRDARLLLARNAVLLAAAVSVAVFGPLHPLAGALRWPGPGEIVPAILVAVSGVLAFVLMRAVSRLREPA